MMCRILLLLKLTCCVCAGTFEVNVTQTSYQAEENDDITLEWTFTTKPGSSLRSLVISCHMIKGHRVSVLFDLRGGDEVPVKDGELVGRVQCDKDVLTEGRIRLNVSSLRTDDSGWYTCEVMTDYGVSLSRCHLNVTAARDRPKPETEPETEAGGTNIWRWGWIGLCCVLVMVLIVLPCVCYCVFIRLRHARNINFLKSREGCVESDRSADDQREQVANNFKAPVDNYQLVIMEPQ
uniref:CD276 antigen-like n=1 Tax=Semicossyphus pulcher TaxID=241346 RepID=UPI0037E8E0DD